MPRRWGLLAAALVVAHLVAASSPAASRRVDLGDGMVAALAAGKEPLLEALPRLHEGLNGFSERLCGSVAAVKAIAAANGGTRRLLAGVRYKIPFEALRPELQARVVAALFEADSASSDGWHHVVAAGSEGETETLWRIAQWFTGDGANYRRLREHNELADEEIHPGQRLVIPTPLLRPALLPSVAAVQPRLPPPSSDLEFGRDAQGEYASYALRAGEALYSSVVVRFTGRIYADDVNRLAEEIAERSKIRDVTDIPVGFRVRIPLDLLQPEFLPLDDPRRREAEIELAAAGIEQPQRSRDLAGVTLVLDAGHGGRDVGASFGDVWESLYVYDITMRVRRILQSETAAEVIMTTRDGGDFRVTERDVLNPSRAHTVLVTPPYPIEDSRVSSNFRWYLANSLYRRRGDADRSVFLSIHADSLHPSLRGTMIYVPGLLENPPNYGKTETVYTSRREVREKPRITLSNRDRERSKGLSLDLAQHLLRSFGKHDLEIHANKPIRDRVIRNRSAWVPAVLRFNEIPAKVLVEVCNLANSADRQLIQTRAFRERVARAIVDGLREYYGGAGGTVQVAGG